MPFAGIKTEYDPNILNRRLAAELGLQAQRQQIESKGLEQALAAQLAPLQAQTQMLQALKLQQALDPNYQASQRAQELSDRMELARYTNSLDPKYVYDAAGNAFLPDATNPRNLLPAFIGGAMNQNRLSAAQTPIQLPNVEIPIVQEAPSSDQISEITGEIPASQAFDQSVTPTQQIPLTQFVGRIPGKTIKTAQEDAYQQALTAGSKAQIFRDPLETEQEYITRVGSANANVSGLSEKQEKFVNALNKELLDEKTFKDYNGAATSYGVVKDIVESSRKTGGAASDDIAMVYTFMKSLDPSSTVNTGEHATAKNAGGVPEQIRNMWNKMVDGTSLTQPQREQFLTTVGRAVTANKNQFDRVRNVYSGRFKRMGVDPIFLAGFEEENAKPTGSATKKYNITVE